MIQSHICSHCKSKGEVYLPLKKPTDTIVKCLVCDKTEDIAYLYNTNASREEMERKEYERLKRIYG